MQFTTKFQHYMTLTALWINLDILKTGVCNEANFRTPGISFQEMCANIVALHDAGLTRLRDVRKNDRGEFVELAFEELFTPAGEALRNQQLRFELEPDVKDKQRRMLERMAITGESCEPLINSSGDVVAGVMNTFLSPDQIREHAKRQLRIMAENDLFDGAKEPPDGIH